MSTSRERLHQRYARWVTAATRDGTPEQIAKETALRKRMTLLYPQRGRSGRITRLMRRYRAWRNDCIIPI